MDIKASDKTIYRILSLDKDSGKTSAAPKKVVGIPVSKKDSTNFSLKSDQNLKGCEITFDPQKPAAACLKDVDIGDPHLELYGLKVNEKTSLSVAGTVLSAVKVPEVEPLRMAVNYMSTDTKKQTLAENIEKGDIEAVTTNTIDYAKSGWGTAVSAAKVTDSVINAGVDLGLLSANVSSKVGTVTASVSRISTKIAIPLALVGNGLSVLDLKKSQDKINKKESEIKSMEKNNNFSETGNISNGTKAKKVKYNLAKEELANLKINRNIKTASLGLSLISTGALITSVKKPSTAYIAIPVSFVAGIASSVVSIAADNSVREMAKYNIKYISDTVHKKLK